MRGHLLPYRFGTLFQREFILPVLEYFLYSRIIVKPRAGSPSTSVYKPFITYSRGEAKDTSARFISLLRMGFSLYYMPNIILYVTMYGCCLLQELFRVPISQNPLVGSQMLFDVSIAIRLVASCMGGNFLVFDINIYRCTGIEDIDFLAYVFIGYTVVMPLQAYIAILLYSSHMPLLKFKTDGVQWPHAITFQFFELFTSAVATPTEQRVVCSSRTTLIAAFKEGRS